MIKLLLVDDDPDVRCGLRMRLGLEPDIDIAGEAGDGAAAIREAKAKRPDVVVMDVQMPGMDGLEAAAALRREFPDIRVIMLSIHDSPGVRHRASECGASGFVGKHQSTDSLLAAIRALAGLPHTPQDATLPAGAGCACGCPPGCMRCACCRERSR